MFPANNFRCHPVGRSHQGVPLFVPLDIGTETEIRDLDPAVNPEENIIGFDVSMKNPLLVKV